MANKKTRKRKPTAEITDYDTQDTSTMIRASEALSFEDLGLKLPETPPTQVVSIRLPSQLLNELKALASQRDIPYQALIKLFLSESVEKMKKKSA